MSDVPERRRRAGEDDDAARRARDLTERWASTRAPRAAPAPDEDAAVLARLGEVVTRDFASWCAIDLIDESGAATRVVDVGADASARAALDLERLLVRARDGEGALAWPAHAALASCIVEDLRVEGRIAATVALGRDEATAGIGPLERVALRDVLWEAALDLERGRLRRRTRDAVRDAQRVARRLHEVLAVALATGERDERSLLTLFAARVRETLDADEVVIGLVEPPLRATSDASGTRVTEAAPATPAGAPGWWRTVLGGALEPVVGEILVRREAPPTLEDEEVAHLLARLATSALAASALHRSVRASEARWRTLVESAPMGIVETDLDGAVTWWNHAAGDLVGWPAPPAAVSWPAALLAPLETLWEPLRATGPASAPAGAVDLDAVDIDGVERSLVVATRLVDPGTGAPARLLTLLDDVTDHRRLRRELRHAQTMEVRGQVASTIAHDFNNLLTLISGYAEVLEGELAGREQAELVHSIQVTAARAAALTAQLQSIGRSREAVPVVLDPRAALGANADVLERVVGPAIEVVWQWAPSIGRVRVDADQFEQVLLNLAINARDAMAKGGRLTITVDEVDLGRSDERWRVAPGRYVRVEVADTGVGMDEETQRRCFEPLFTTKGPLRGTGMGLASARRTIDESRGAIRIDSRPGEGTTVAFVLPVVDEALDEPATPPATATTRSIPSARVLLVEDDETLRRLVGAILRRHGHEVLDVASVEAALAAVADEETFDLLVSDVALGTGRGDELARTLRAAQPTLAVLLTSGSADASVLEGLAAPAAFLAKPFKPSQVIDEVVALLTRPVRTTVAPR